MVDCGSVGEEVKVLGVSGDDEVVEYIAGILAEEEDEDDEEGTLDVLQTCLSDYCDDETLVETVARKLMALAKKAKADKAKQQSQQNGNNTQTGTEAILEAHAQFLKKKEEEAVKKKQESEVSEEMKKLILKQADKDEDSTIPIRVDGEGSGADDDDEESDLDEDKADEQRRLMKLFTNKKKAKRAQTTAQDIAHSFTNTNRGTLESRHEREVNARRAKRNADMDTSKKAEVKDKQSKQQAKEQRKQRAQKQERRR